MRYALHPGKQDKGLLERRKERQKIPLPFFNNNPQGNHQNHGMGERRRSEILAQGRGISLEERRKPKSGSISQEGQAFEHQRLRFGPQEIHRERGRRNRKR